MVFNQVNLKSVPRNFFDLSYEKKFCADMGLLYPIYLEECLAGDRVKLKNEIVVRFQPLVAPVLHTIKVRTEYYFIPFRIMFDDWESFITGGVDGHDSTELPLWDDYTVPESGEAVTPPKNSLWDLFSLPLVSPPSLDDTPLSFARTAYNMVWNKFYRDENVDERVSEDNNDLLRRRWRKDYFTSSLPFQQRGVAPGFPITGDAPLVGNSPVVFGDEVSFSSLFSNVPASTSLFRDYQDSENLLGLRVIPSGSMTGGLNPPAKGDPFVFGGGPSASESKLRSLVADNSGIVAKTSDLATFDIKDLRLANQIQIMLEINARCGVRYDEFLLAHFGVSPRDSRIDEPEFLGATSSPLLVSEVLQTSETTESSPQGSLAGRGIGLSEGFVAKFTAPEPGLVLGLMSICPNLEYSSQGVSKFWTRRSRYDFYFPTLSHLSEQAVKSRELYLSDDADDNAEVFGYQGVYDEYRFRLPEVCGDMRDTFAYWHLARSFSEAPALNSEFIEMNPDKRIFAVQNEPGFVVDVNNIAKFVRPLPKFATPGMERM